MSEHVDVLVIGAGLSGIDAGYRLQTGCPGKSYLILEARDRASTLRLRSEDGKEQVVKP